jgi:Na+/H+-translocating membrane pyrophosphatase
MKTSFGFIVGAIMSIFALLVMIWRSTLSIQMFTEIAHAPSIGTAQSQYAMQHMSATLNLGRILPGIGLFGIALMITSHLLYTRRLSKETGLANKPSERTR